MGEKGREVESMYFYVIRRVAESALLEVFESRGK